MMMILGLTGSDCNVPPQAQKSNGANEMNHRCWLTLLVPIILFKFEINICLFTTPDFAQDFHLEKAHCQGWAANYRIPNIRWGTSSL